MAQKKSRARKKQPWHKQSGEPEAAYQAFRLFLKSDRRLISVSRRAGKPHTTISNWARKHSWNARAEVADIWRDRQLERNERKRLREMATRHVDESIVLQEKGIQRLMSIDSTKISPNVAVRMIEVGIAIERKTFGDPKQALSERDNIDSAPMDLSKLSDDELEDYERLIAKAKQ